MAGGLLGVAGWLTRVALELADRNAAGEQTILLLQAAEAALVDDNRQLVEANSTLDAKKNRIRMSPLPTGKTPVWWAGRAKLSPP